jgi:hypothetical protein
VKGERLMDRSESLDGWWHAFFDTAAWQPELAAPTVRAGHVPSVVWDNLEDRKESVRVPGIWRDARPEFRGVVWYWRPFVLAADWGHGIVSVHFGAVRGRMEVYLDKALIGMRGAINHPFVCDLNPVGPDRVHTLTIRVVHCDDTGGVYGPVTLIHTSPGSD